MQDGLTNYIMRKEITMSSNNRFDLVNFNKQKTRKGAEL